MSDLQKLHGVGEQAERLLAKIGIYRVSDLLENIPRGYDDYSTITNISALMPGPVTIQAKITAVKKRYSKKGLHITEALATDATGSVRIMWFNQPYRAQSLKLEQDYYLSGVFAGNYKYFVLSNPTCELVSSFPLHTARLVPRYKLTKGLSAHRLREYTKQASRICSAEETLPDWVRSENNLILRHEALLQLHFPKKLDDVAQAKRRIGFEELFEMMLASELNRRDFKAERAMHISIHENEVKEFVASLPFQLTDDQRRSAWQILQDMTSGRPMNRLLQGDVGSGKTVIAAIAMFNVMHAGFQTALMAPTEILAAQHERTLRQLLPQELSAQIVYLSSNVAARKKKRILEDIKEGRVACIVGTHALVQKHVEFHSLALAIIDEQHRFGVEQRKLLQGKALEMPHVLNMTATPIPRSIALTLYGDMDSSLLRQKPSLREAVETKIVIPEARKSLYESLYKEIMVGRQIFIVCPIIEEDERPGRSLHLEWIAKQAKSWIKEAKIEILHGKMKPDQKENIMHRFIDRHIDILVATTVIEVGVDVPNATVMIIEGADRFGLAQLHQLRGRIGRGSHKGTCYLVPTDNEPIAQRLRIIETENDGFKLADYDLELRGPGAIYGTMQHGALDLRIARITDAKLIAEARETAREFIKRDENLLKYPKLEARVHRLRTITNLN